MMYTVHSYMNFMKIVHILQCTVNLGYLAVLKIGEFEKNLVKKFGGYFWRNYLLALDFFQNYSTVYIILH